MRHRKSLFIKLLKKDDKRLRPTNRELLHLPDLLVYLKQKRSNEEIIQHIKIDKNPLVRRIQPNPATKEEYIFDRGKVLDIIEIVDNQGIQFEKTPSSYKSLGENALRDIILSTLNSIFAGSATGATFLHKGKTDIYPRIDRVIYLSSSVNFGEAKSFIMKR